MVLGDGGVLDGTHTTAVCDTDDTWIPRGAAWSPGRLSTEPAAS